MIHSTFRLVIWIIRPKKIHLMKNTCNLLHENRFFFICDVGSSDHQQSIKWWNEEVIKKRVKLSHTCQRGNRGTAPHLSFSTRWRKVISIMLRPSLNKNPCAHWSGGWMDMSGDERSPPTRTLPLVHPAPCLVTPDPRHYTNYAKLAPVQQLVNNES